MAVVTTDPRIHSASSTVLITTSIRRHSFSDSVVQTSLRIHSTSSGLTVTTGLRAIQTSQTSAAFETIRKTFAYHVDNVDLSVAFVSSTGGSAALCNTHTLVISQNASSTMTFSVNMIDKDFAWHPYGTGAYKDVMVDGAEVSMAVTLEGETQHFFGTFKAQSVTVDSSTKKPVSQWPGVCEGEKLFKNKKTLETLNSNPLVQLTTKREGLAEACTAAGVDGNWNGIQNQKLGGPFHRQNITPGNLVQKMLELTVDEWRTEYKTIVGYDPDTGGTTWTYDLDADQIGSLSVTPTNNDEILGVVVLRAVATGQLQVSGGAANYTEVDTFGQYTVNFSPPISMGTVREEYRDFRGSFSNFLWYRGPLLVAIRKPFGSLGNLAVSGGQIYDCDRCVFTWGETYPGVTTSGTLGVKGGINFYGRQTPAGTIGTGENAQDKLDNTRRVVVGVEDGALELQPNPLFYNSTDMTNFGTRYLDRIGKARVEHQIKLPLNHKIKCGDKIRIDMGAKFGGITKTFLVVGWTHTISQFAATRNTTVSALLHE